MSNHKEYYTKLYVKTFTAETAINSAVYFKKDENDYPHTAHIFGTTHTITTIAAAVALEAQYISLLFYIYFFKRNIRRVAKKHKENDERN